MGEVITGVKWPKPPAPDLNKPTIVGEFALDVKFLSLPGAVRFVTMSDESVIVHVAGSNVTGIHSDVQVQLTVTGMASMIAEASEATKLAMTKEDA